MNNKIKNKLYSPVQQDFIWLAEYSNGKFLSEFNYHNQKENNFYDIDKNNLLRFGLVGHGMKFYYETPTGIINICGRQLDFIYKTKDKDYNLTKQKNIFYNDIIQYKDAISLIDPLNDKKRVLTRVEQFNFGYKVKMNIDEINFNFKPIIKIPFEKPVYLYLRLVADKDLDGKLLIIKNNKIVKEFDAPIQANVGGELNWIIH